MRLFYISLIVFCGLLSINQDAFGSDEKPPLEIMKALEEADIDKLCTHFYNRVHIEMPGYIGTVSAKTASNLIKVNFINGDHDKKTDFVLKSYQKTKNNTRVLLGEYVINEETSFSILVNIKMEDDKPTIYQIQIIN
jgi:hypothetical protein